MKIDRVTKALLWTIAILLFVSIGKDFWGSRSALATAGDVGRFQIAAWSAQSGRYSHQYGYFVLDTTTGKVVSTESETQGFSE